MTLRQRAWRRVRQYVALLFALNFPETKRSTNPLPVSTNFKYAVHDETTDFALCYCGRFHFTSSGEYEEGELERYRALARSEPKRWIEHDDLDGLFTGTVEHYTFVLSCECNYLRSWEDLFWRNRHVIAEYFRLRAAAATREAVLTQKIADEVSSVEGGDE